MKKVMMILLFSAVIFSFAAEENKQHKEIGISFRSLDSFGLTYRTGTEKGLWRFNAIGMWANRVDDSETINTEAIEDSLLVYYDGKKERTSTVFSFQASLGREFRKNIDEKLVFRYGLDLLFNYRYLNDEYTINKTDYSTEHYQKETRYEPGFGVLIGFNYPITKVFTIGAEFVPSIRYTIRNNYRERIRIPNEEYSYYNYLKEISDTDSNGLRFSLSNSVLLSLVYQF